MKFCEEDVQALFGLLPYARLAKPASARAYFARMVREGSELSAMLAQYPTVRYEPLDQHYVLLRCLACCEEDLIADLCTYYTWRGIVWAATLALLSPLPCFAIHLQSARERAPHNLWLIDLALAEIAGTDWIDVQDLQQQVRTLRQSLSLLPRPAVSLRRAPQVADRDVLVARRERIASVYKSQGAVAARAALLAEQLDD